MPEEGQFLVETNARLCNVEGVKKCVDEDRSHGRMALIIGVAVGLCLGCLVTLLVLYCPLPSIGAGQKVFARMITGLKEVKEYLIALVAGCAIALGMVFITRKKEAF